MGLVRFFGGGAFGAPFFLTVRNVAKVEKYRSGGRIGRGERERRESAWRVTFLLFPPSLVSGNFSYSEAAVGSLAWRLRGSFDHKAGEF